MDGQEIKEKICNEVEKGSRMAYAKTSVTLTNVEWGKILTALGCLDEKQKEPVRR